MNVNLDERKVEFIIKDKMHDNESLNRWIDEFSDIDIDFKYIDKTIAEILVLIHKGNLVKNLYENVFNEEFYSGCDQISTAVAIVLISKGFTKVDMLRSFELNPKKYHQGIIEKAEPEEKYAHLGYIPHNYLVIKMENKYFIVNPKYTSFDSVLKSDISASYHSEFNDNYMSLKHQDSSSKSLLFSNCSSPNIDGFDFDNFPVYIKDKKGSEKIYKSFERTEFVI
jgi:hypothetical protein